MGQGASCTDTKPADNGCVPPADNPRKNRNNVHQRRELLTERILKAIKADEIDRLHRLLDKGLTSKGEKPAVVVEEPDCCVPPSHYSTNRNAVQPPNNGPIDVNSFRFDNDYNCLHVAASNGSVDVVRYLIESRAMDANIQSNVTGATPVHLACLANQLDVVVYFISVLAKLNIADLEGRVALDYCQTQEMKDIINRNMRHEGAVNELSPDLDYGFFKWNKEERFDTENPLRSSGRVNKIKPKIPPPPPTSSSFYMAPSYADDLDDTTSTRADDLQQSSTDQEITSTPHDSNDTEISHRNDDRTSETKTNDIIQSTPPPPPPPPRPISLPVPRVVVKDDRDDDGDDNDNDNENESIKPVSPTSVAVNTSAEKGTTGINSPLFHAYRKSDILAKLSSKNQSGRATSVRIKTAISTSIESPPPPPPPPPPPLRS